MIDVLHDGPGEYLDAVLPKKCFLPVGHRWHTPVTRCGQCVCIGLQLLFIIVRARTDLSA